jgi:hypothetical protein
MTYTEEIYRYFMTEPSQFEAVYKEVGALKVVLRSILDPERVKTSVEVRAAKDEAESVVFKYWRRNLEFLANDDALAREYFSLFPLVAFLVQEVRRHHSWQANCRPPSGGYLEQHERLQ